MKYLLLIALLITGCCSSTEPEPEEVNRLKIYITSKCSSGVYHIVAFANSRDYQTQGVLVDTLLTYGVLYKDLELPGWSDVIDWHVWSTTPDPSGEDQLKVYGELEVERETILQLSLCY